MSRKEVKAVKGTKYLYRCSIGQYYFRRRVPKKYKHSFAQQSEVFVSLSETVKRIAISKLNEEVRKFNSRVRQSREELKNATSCIDEANIKERKSHGIRKIDEELADYFVKCWFIDQVKANYAKLAEFSRLDKLSEHALAEHFNAIGGDCGSYLTRNNNTSLCQRWSQCNELDLSIKILESIDHELDLESGIRNDEVSLEGSSIENNIDALYESTLAVDASEVAKTYGDVSLAKDGESAVRMADLLRRGRIEEYKRYIEQLRSDFASYDKDDFFAGLSRKTILVNPLKERVAPENCSVAELREFYVKRLENKGSVFSTQYKLAFFLLSEQLGDENLIRNFGLSEARQMVEIIKKLPKGFSQIDASISELLEAEEGEYGKIIAPNYKHQIFKTLKTILDYARRSDFMDRNPLEHPSLDHVFPKVESERKHFTVDQINTLFSSKLFQELKGEYPYTTDYWIPLLALFHGLRLGEICELELADISVEGDNYWLDIRLESSEAQNKHIKTEASKRKIPIHPSVLKLGFSDYVKKINKSDCGLLFPDIIADNDKRKSNVYSKRFARFKSKVFKDSPDLVFHSFRHTFRTNITERAKDEVGIRLIGGWSMPKEAAFGYFHDYSDDEKLKLISQVKYEGLDFNNLKQPLKKKLSISKEGYIKRSKRKF